MSLGSVYPKYRGRFGPPSRNGETLAEMNRIARFFVNRFNARRNARVYAWLSANVSLPPSATCLEIGCGNGDLASRVVDGLRPSKYVATDLDPHQLAVAQAHLVERYPNGVPPALQVQAADMLRLPFPDASFDLTVAVVSLHHASANHHDPSSVPNALAEVDRVLRPGGALAYEEILHKDVIRSWLAQHGYAVSVLERGFKRESVVARKPDGSAGS